MKSFRKNIFWSLTALAVLSSLVATFLVTFLLLREQEQEAKARILDEEKNLVSLGVTDFISLAEYREFIDQISSTIPQDQLNEVIHIYVPPGVLLYSNSLQQNWKNSNNELWSHVDRGFYEVSQGKREYLARLRSYKTLDGRTLWLQIATLRTTPWTAVRSIAALFGASLLGLIGVALFFSYWVGRNVTKPIESFAQEISSLDTKAVKAWTSLPAEYLNIAEMIPIASSFNLLIDRLQQTFVRNEYVGRFIAHEIQTPLTVIQGEVEMATMDSQRKDLERSLKASILEEVGKISEVVNTILKFPSGDRNSIPTQIEFWNLQKLTEEILEKIRNTTARAINFDCNEKQVLRIQTDRHLFGLLLSNLIRNADRHTPAGKEIAVSCFREKDLACIEIIDQGHGLSEDVLNAANADSAFSRELGIGLILIKQIAELLKHRVVFENFENQRGLKVKIYLPLYD